VQYTSQDFCNYDGLGDGVANQSGLWDTSETHIVSDILTIPCDDDFFDNAICTDVLEHVPNAFEACKEIKRIVKVGGKILITVPTQCDAHQTPFFYSGGYSEYFFKEVFKGDLVNISFESGYFETVDQKIYLGLTHLISLARSNYKYLIILFFYVLLGFPFIVLIRLLPETFRNIGNNGLLIIITKC
jgi:SAM-dependent methyltransferase